MCALRNFTPSIPALRDVPWERGRLAPDGSSSLTVCAIDRRTTRFAAYIIAIVHAESWARRPRSIQSAPLITVTPSIPALRDVPWERGSLARDGSSPLTLALSIGAPRAPPLTLSLSITLNRGRDAPAPYRTHCRLHFAIVHVESGARRPRSIQSKPPASTCAIDTGVEGCTLGAGASRPRWLFAAYSFRYG